MPSLFPLAQPLSLWNRHFGRVQYGVAVLTTILVLNVPGSAVQAQQVDRTGSATSGVDSVRPLSNPALYRNRARRDSLIEVYYDVRVDHRRRNEVRVATPELQFSQLAEGEFVFAGDLLERLTQRMEGRRRETVFCLTGQIEKNRALVTGFYQPQIIRETESRVQHTGCDELAADHVGKLHNHPLHHLTTEGKKAQQIQHALTRVRDRAPASPRDLCYLSPRDKNNTLYDFGVRRKQDEEFQVVMVGARVRCWWSWEQVDQRATDTLIEPLEGQIEVSSSSLVHSSTLHH